MNGVLFPRSSKEIQEFCAGLFLAPLYHRASEKYNAPLIFKDLQIQRGVHQDEQKKKMEINIRKVG